MFTKYVNVLIYLFTIFALLSTTACGAVANGAMYVEPVAPIIAEGQTLAITSATFYNWTNTTLVGHTPMEVWYSPNYAQQLIRYASPWARIQVIAVVNTLETAPAYWQNLQGMLMNEADAQSFIEKAKTLGWNCGSIKDTAFTTFAAKVAYYTGLLAVSGETLLFGATFDIGEIWQTIILPDAEDL